MHQELISVIVPIYNGENYVYRCVESICNQTYKNLEIILVDDGSTDNTRVICEKLAGSDKRIRFIHQINQGSGAARNMGLSLCKGSWVNFVDCDDWIDASLIEILYEKAAGGNVDLCIYTRSYYGQPGTCFIGDKRDISQIVLHMFDGNRGIGIGVVGKLYRTELIKSNKIEFIDPKCAVMEDYIWQLDYIPLCRGVIIIEETEALYHVTVDNQNSRSRGYKKDQFLQIVENDYRLWCHKFHILDMNMEGKQLAKSLLICLARIQFKTTVRTKTIAYSDKLKEIKWICNNQSLRNAVRSVKNDKFKQKIMNICINLRLVHTIYFLTFLQNISENNKFGETI